MLDTTRAEDNMINFIQSLVNEINARVVQGEFHFHVEIPLPMGDEEYYRFLQHLISLVDTRLHIRPWPISDYRMITTRRFMVTMF